MAKEYSVSDLTTANRLFPNLLRVNALQNFYMRELIPYTFNFNLANGDSINLTFDEDQFCHLLGFSYFGYNGKRGWNSLLSSNILISNLPDFAKHKREEIRITNFPKILEILHNPSIYLFKNTCMNYKSDYFAVWNDSKRYYKLGIGIKDDSNNYGETFQVSLINSNDNKEIDAQNLIRIIKKEIIKR